MSITKSEFAVSELAHLDAVAPDAAVVLSFEEAQGVRIAAWAAGKFGGQVLVGRVIDQYNQNPQRQDGQPVSIYDTGSQQWSFALEAADEVAADVARDLTGAVKRIERGYPLDSFSVRGVEDTAVVIGSLEKAVEMNPENLSEGERYMQAAAHYMLDHMQVLDSKPDQSVSYLV
jgi:hypothetical protein